METQQTLHTANILQVNDGQIRRVTLQNREITVELTNIGASIVAIHTPDKNGAQKNVVAGFKDLAQYYHNKDYMGCTIGRCANRISGGMFSLNGENYQLTVNDGNNHLHGGLQGFHVKPWQVDAHAESGSDCSVTFSYYSADGEEGYPGNVYVKVQYELSQNRLNIYYTATTDKQTPVNITNHSYFNLTGFETPTILDHTLQVNAAYYTEKSPANTPTGTILPVEGTGLDLRSPVLIGERINSFPSDMGYDHNFVLQNGRDVVRAAVLGDVTSGRSLTVYTNKPGIQVYTANHWDGASMGTQGKPYVKHGAVALETQLFPDSVNHPNFPDCILHPGEIYNYRTIFMFDVIK